MPAPRKKISARFYRTANGTEPVRDWLLELDTDDRRVVGKDIQKVEFGWPIGMPYSRPMGHGLYEVRSSISSGRIVRVLFAIEGDQMILLHGFTKKTQATPQREIDTALKRLKGVSS